MGAQEKPPCCQPGTWCQWSLEVTTLTRDDSRASKRFTPQKVKSSDICCQKGDTVVGGRNCMRQYVKGVSSQIGEGL